MEKRKAIEEILFHDYGRIDETTVDKIMLLFYNTEKSEQLVCDHEWLDNSYDHFGFLIDQFCDKCGEKQYVP